MDKKQLKMILKSIKKRIENEIEEHILSVNYDNCFGCGESNNRVLVDHHTDWIKSNGHPKSNKTGPVIKLCFNCHHLIHNQIPFGVDINDDDLLEMVNSHILANSPLDVSDEIKNLLFKVAVSRFEPKSFLKSAAFSLWIINSSKGGEKI